MKITPDIFAADTIHDAWRTCAGHLVQHGARLNLMVHIGRPDALDEPQMKLLDPHRVVPSVMSVFDVATTIFPRRSGRWSLPVDDFVAHYLPTYARLKRRQGGGWGFYFQRLASFGSSGAPQLRRLIEGLSSWGHGHHGAFVVHLSSAQTDRPRPQGGPCWQYGQLMAHDNALSLLAVYRSHDYFQKALGNFAGLSRLLTYVCSKTGHTVGTLTCVSTYAFLGSHRAAAATLLQA